MFDRADFPPGFLFGAATSAYQIEGTRGAGRCHWDDFAETPGTVAGGATGARACDHLNRWPGDLDLMREAGLDIYRFSTSWARVMPDGRQVAPEGLDFYDRLVDGMLARGLRPALTLYHWELPSALADLGGWRNRDIALWFGDFTERVMARLGDRLWSVAPVNEPWCVSWLSHFEGHHAPGLRDIRATARAMHHVLLAHGQAVAAIRAEGRVPVGAVLNFEPALPVDAAAAPAAARRDAIYNRFFLEALAGRGYPEPVLEGLGPHLPQGWAGDLPLIAQPLDWIGVNYYTCARVAPAPGPWPGLCTRPGDLPKTAIGWEIRPEGLTEVLCRVAETLPGLPIHITECGMAGPERPDAAGRIEDGARIAWLSAHLAAARAALARGVPLQSFVFWTLLDNFEWALGYAPRFGLVHVDPDSLQRVPKASYWALKAALTS